MSNTEPFNNLCLQVVSEVLSSTPPAAGYGQDQGEPGTGEPGPILENPHSGHRFGEQRRGQIKMKNPKNSFYLNKDNNSDWPISGVDSSLQREFEPERKSLRCVSLRFCRLLCDCRVSGSLFNSKRKDGRQATPRQAAAHAARLLLEHVDGVLVIHLQLRRCVRFVNWLPIEPESNLPH